MTQPTESQPDPFLGENLPPIPTEQEVFSPGPEYADLSEVEGLAAEAISEIRKKLRGSRRPESRYGLRFNPGIG